MASNCDCDIVRTFKEQVEKLQAENLKLHNVIDVVRKYQKWIDIPGFAEALEFLEDE